MRPGKGGSGSAPRGAGVPGGPGPAASADSAPLPSAPLRGPARSLPHGKECPYLRRRRGLSPEARVPLSASPPTPAGPGERWRRSCRSTGGRGSGSGSSSSRGGDWYLCLAAAPAPSRGEGGEEKSLPDGGPGPGLAAFPRTVAADLLRLPAGRGPGGGRRDGKLRLETLPPLRRPSSSLRTRLTGKHRSPQPRPPLSLFPSPRFLSPPLPLSRMALRQPRIGSDSLEPSSSKFLLV